jgi:hypothetical protein
MHDGAPPQFHRTPRDHLNLTFGEQWLGLGDPVTDLNDPLILILWIFGCLNT